MTDRQATIATTQRQKENIQRQTDRRPSPLLRKQKDKQRRTEWDRDRRLPPRLHTRQEEKDKDKQKDNDHHHSLGRKGEREGERERERKQADDYRLDSSSRGTHKKHIHTDQQKDRRPSSLLLTRQEVECPVVKFVISAQSRVADGDGLSGPWTDLGRPPSQVYRSSVAPPRGHHVSLAQNRVQVAALPAMSSLIMNFDNEFSALRLSLINVSLRSE